ncbi:MAG TPA: ComEC/Rec2 family competence protein [Candidatus Saccharimonadales bacterium]|nr:ComEC/Rec2 family competence protein [Candidatus Saccharimonadales bacterium]
MGRRKKFWRTTLIMYGLAAFLAGLGLARLKTIAPSGLVICIVFFVAITARKKSYLTLVSIVFCGLVFGWWRGSVYMLKLQPYQDLKNRAVIMIGVADTDAVYGDKSQLSFDVSNLQITDPVQMHLVGKVSVKGFGVPMVYKGDKVQLEGRLYLTRGSKQAGISFAQIAVLEPDHSRVQSIKRQFEAGMQSALPEPLASFSLGLLIGQRSTLPESVTNQLSAVGLTHVVAVSGYNLTIIVLAVSQVLKKRSKYQNMVCSLLLIGLFLLFTGLSASIVRAALVSVLGLVSWYYGRQIRPLLLILLAAAFTAGWYPLYAWTDIGWYLSFLAFYGVLIVAPLVTKRWYKDKKPSFVTLLVIETMAAQIMTVPLIMYIFGQYSVVALLANILVVPLVPLAMLLTLVAGMGGMLVPQIAGWLALPARLLLTYMLDIVALFSRIPFAVAHPHINASAMVSLYGVVIFLTMVLWFKTRSKNAIITDTNEKARGV